MQLSRTNTRAGSLHVLLASAVSGLLGQAHAQSLRTGEWQADSAVLVYKEGDGRVQAVEPIISVRRTEGTDRSTALRLTFDSLTGASPNGAVAQPTAQTFTNPSGRGGGYSTPAGQAPLDPRFHDRRIALNGTLERPFGEDQRISLGANGSVEHDFRSLSVSANIARDLFQKNTTLSAGLAVEVDRINPEGGVLAGLKPAFDRSTALGSSDSRRVVDVLAGVTQVMSRRWLVQLSYDLGRASGYQSDPYKVLSVLDADGLLTGDRYIVEDRPRSRTRHSLSVQSKWHLTRDVLDLSYRYYRDDWGLRAHTVDARYRWEPAGGWYLEPHVRWYRQNAADFYRTWLNEGGDYDSAASASRLAHASADTRLAAFTARTLGLKFALPLSGGQELSLRVESYRQQLKGPGDVPPALRGLELAPNLRATSVMFGYSLPF